jgi:aerobic-type carbon monoxide dehydrogenase small subunit (CoxS/CutS family)
MPIVSSIAVNGRTLRVDADADRPLLNVLRDDLGITGPKFGCGEGECGACTVLLDGAPVRSCRTKVGSVGGKKVATVESLEVKGKLHPVQQAFLDEEAMQCAYCTSGMVLTAAAFLKRNPDPTRAEVIEAMDGNICRCGTYQRIIAAVLSAAKTMREGQ